MIDLNVLCLYRCYSLEPSEITSELTVNADHLLHYKVCTQHIQYTHSCGYSLVSASALTIVRCRKFGPDLISIKLVSLICEICNF